MKTKKLGPYVILAPLAAGVWLARGPDGARLALKVGPAGAAAGAAFLRAARLAATLDHPHIVAVHAVGEGGGDEHGGAPWLAMDYVDGPSLAARLAQSRPAPAQALAWTMQLLHGLAHAHARGVVHRDIKPANLLLDFRHTAQGSVKIADFGLASDAGGAGTPNYMAPEQMRGRSDGRSDLYAAAVVLYQMLAGARPFGGAPFDLMRQVLHDAPQPLPPALAAWQPALFRALAKSPAARQQTADEFITDLQSI